MRYFFLILAVIALTWSIAFVDFTYGLEKYSGDRVIDATVCTSMINNAKMFVSCVNYVICNSDITLKDPIGEYFGIKVVFPEVVPGTEDVVVWGIKIYKSQITDSESAAWCVKHGAVKKESKPKSRI